MKELDYGSHVQFEDKGELKAGFVVSFWVEADHNGNSERVPVTFKQATANEKGLVLVRLASSQVQEMWPIRKVEKVEHKEVGESPIDLAA